MKNDFKQDRAKIFLPFSALRGFKEALKKKERVIVDKKILSNDEKLKLSNKLTQIKKGTIIKVTYFDDGEYVELVGMVSNIDFIYKSVTIVNTKIMFNDILEIKSDNIKDEENYYEFENYDL